MGFSVAVFWPGIISFLVLWSIGIAALWLRSQRIPSRARRFWLVGALLAAVFAHAVTVFIVEPFILR